MIKTTEYFECENKIHWLEKISASDWDAGAYLHHLLQTETLRDLCGKTTRVYMLTDGDELLSFCTLAEQDDIRDSELSPWIGFVYTFPAYRGHRYSEALLNAAYRQAKQDGAGHIYISTNEIGLYEKYGYSFYKMMKDINGEASRVYRIKID